MASNQSGTYKRTPEIRQAISDRYSTPEYRERFRQAALKQWAEGRGARRECPTDCPCGKHKPQTEEQRRRRRCEPGCQCGKHFRTAEHNRRIGEARREAERNKRLGIPSATELRRQRYESGQAKSMDSPVREPITVKHPPRKATQK